MRNEKNNFKITYGNVRLEEEMKYFREYLDNIRVDDGKKVEAFVWDSDLIMQYWHKVRYCKDIGFEISKGINKNKENYEELVQKRNKDIKGLMNLLKNLTIDDVIFLYSPRGNWDLTPFLIIEGKFSDEQRGDLKKVINTFPNTPHNGKDPGEEYGPYIKMGSTIDVGATYKETKHKICFYEAESKIFRAAVSQETSISPEEWDYQKRCIEKYAPIAQKERVKVFSNLFKTLENILTNPK